MNYDDNTENLTQALAHKRVCYQDYEHTDGNDDDDDDDDDDLDDNDEVLTQEKANKRINLTSFLILASWTLLSTIASGHHYYNGDENEEEKNFEDDDWLLSLLSVKIYNDDDDDDDWTTPDGSHGFELASLVLLSPGL